jgi:DNA-binding transcriptional ArsR family regulator
LLEGETEPSERHYTLAKKWLDFCTCDIELDRYAEVQKTLRNLSEEEYEKIKNAIEEKIKEEVAEKGGGETDSHLFKIVDYLVKHGKTRRDELAAYLEVDEKTVTRKVNVFKGLGLLRSDKDGYSFTAKGVMFVKRWLNRVPEVPNVSTSKGQTPSEGGAKTSLPSKSGDIKDIRDMDRKEVKKKYRILGETAGVCELCGEAGSDVEVEIEGLGKRYAHRKCVEEAEEAC